MIPDNMEKCIDAAIGYSSYKNVYEYLMKRMKEDYEYLNHVFKTINEIAIEEKIEKVVEKPVENTIENTKTDVSGNNVPTQPKEKKPVKKAKTNTIENVDTSGNHVETENKDVVAVAVAETVDSSGNVVDENVDDVSNSGTEPDVKLNAKQKQKLKQEATRARLEKEGKTPKDILTEDNLRQWIVNENKSYAKIAANYAGCTEQEVSIIANGYKLKSSYAGKKGVVYGKTKAN